MNAWLRQHRDALRDALARLPRTGGLLSIVVIGVALALPAGGYVALESLRSLGARMTLEPQLSVFLRPEAKRAEAEALGVTLRADARIARVRFVPREQAFRELSAVQGMSEILGALGRNPLPDAYVVQPKDDAPAALEALARDLARGAAVAHVEADSAWARRLGAIAALVRTALWLLAALLAAGLVAVTFNTIRLQILTRRDEIELARLIGATDSFIRRPFYYLGLLQGLAGGVLALGIVAAGLALLNRQVAALSESYGSAFRLGFPGAGDAVALLAFAAVLGWLGASLSVTQQLRRMGT
ncbi:MAG TPA: permease-like cell division protein FtsX [Burkholderiales bacterium]|nr:permease-like cell division protein FtsX [Burkholderiales bacterium]